MANLVYGRKDRPPRVELGVLGIGRRLLSADDGATGVPTVWAWFGLAFVFALMFGFEYRLPLFVLVYALANKINWPVAILVTVIQWAVITGVFGLLMEVPWSQPWVMQMV
jgi:hypothetical protein